MLARVEWAAYRGVPVLGLLALSFGALLFGCALAYLLLRPRMRKIRLGSVLSLLGNGRGSTP